MHNLVLSPIDPDILISSIVDRVTANVLQAVNLQSAEPAERILSIQEAAEFLTLSVPTIYGKVSRREIPYMKRGKRLYFSQPDLVEYLKGGRGKTTEELNAQADAELIKSKTP